MRNEARKDFFERFEALGREELLAIMTKLNTDDLRLLENLLSRAVIGDFDQMKVELDANIKELHYVPRPTYKASTKNAESLVQVAAS